MQHHVDTMIASAGTGKTYRLVEKIVGAVLKGVPPHRIVATTFTKKAASELAGRVRAKLIELGKPELAAAMLSARIGTVNAVCGGFLGEFAFELGRSPVTEVIAEDRRSVLFERASGAVIEECGPAISEIADRLGIRARGYSLNGRAIRGWQDEVRRAVDLARSNCIPPERLEHCAARSAESMLALLPPATGTGDALDRALGTAVEDCQVEIARTRDTLKGGTLFRDVPIVELASRLLRAGEHLPWPTWAALTKLGSTKTDAPLFARVTAAASAHPRHPALAADIRIYIERIFDCASRCMAEYARYKRERGLIDFVDQEMLALDIALDPRNAGRLRELIGAVFVDEFQDSSPIQIAIFSALSRIAERSVWVGDPKQSIYRFRDADPALTSAASAAITAASGGSTSYLRRSYRTRPQLAELVNAAVGPNFRRTGMTTEEIEFDGCERADEDTTPPALSFWTTSGRKKGDRTTMLASRIAGLLTDPTSWPVSLKDGGQRAARGGDIAVLCRGNAQIADLAHALSMLGIRVAAERPGLLHRPEVELALAAFRWIADESDTLALAELARLSTDDTWFPSAFADNPRGQLAARLPFSDALKSIRTRAQQLTPVEVMDALLHAESVTATILAWGDSEQRLQNLEALRDLVSTYQDEQRVERQAATLVGACVWLASRNDAPQPRSRHSDAVNVLTYHGAKGLEWPIVILTELDSEARGSPFGLTAESETTPDWIAPLSGRTIRFWPWPYGDHTKGVALDVAAAASPRGIAAHDAELLERTRLLYVGLTRARDHLALAMSGGSLTWLDELRNDAGRPLVAAADDAVTVGDRTFAKRAQPETRGPISFASEGIVAFTRPAVSAVEHPPLKIRPSIAAAHVRAFTVAATERLGARIPLLGDPDLHLLGEAIHGFLAADDHERDSKHRARHAAAILARWGVPNLAPTDLLEVSDRLRVFFEGKYGAAPHVREWPIHVEEGLQVVSGRLDHLIDLGDGYAIVDHKSFPGSLSMDHDRLQEFANQVSIYSRAIRSVSGRKRFECWIHQPIAAVMTRIELYR